MSDYSLFGFEDVSKLSPKFFNNSIENLENVIIKSVAYIYRLTSEGDYQGILFHTNGLEVLIAKLELTKRLIEVVGEPAKEIYHDEVLSFLLVGLGDEDEPNGRNFGSASVTRNVETMQSIMSNSAHILHVYTRVDAS